MPEPSQRMLAKHKSDDDDRRIVELLSPHEFARAKRPDEF